MAFPFGGLTPEQIEQRREGLHGGDAGDIVAGDWPKLFRIKKGYEPSDDLSNVLRVLMGVVTEPFNCWWFEKQTGRKIIRRNEYVTHPVYPWMRGNIDGETVTGDNPLWVAGQRQAIDCKHVGQSGEAVTIRYTAPLTHYATILGVNYWCLSVFVGNSKWELVEQEIDPLFQAEYIAMCREFWSYVERDIEPPGVAPLPVPPPRKLRTVLLEDEFDWPNWGSDFADQMDAFAGTAAAAKLNALARRRIKDLLPDDVGTVLRQRTRVTRSRNDAIRITVGTRDEEDG
jgi:hypothetical protein